MFNLQIKRVHLLGGLISNCTGKHQEADRCTYPIMHTFSCSSWVERGVVMGGTMKPPRPSATMDLRRASPRTTASAYRISIDSSLDPLVKHVAFELTIRVDVQGSIQVRDKAC